MGDDGRTGDDVRRRCTIEDERRTLRLETQQKEGELEGKGGATREDERRKRRGSIGDD